MKHFWFFVLFSYSLSGCLSNKKLARLCEEKFPIHADTVTLVRDSVRSDTVKAIDFVQIPVHDTVNCPPSDSPTVVVKTGIVDCPPSTVITKTEVKWSEKTITVENPYKLNRALNTIDSLKEQITLREKTIEKAEKRFNNMKKLLLTMFAFILLLFGFIRFFK
jgi:hypothetical protein